MAQHVSAAFSPIIRSVQLLLPLESGGWIVVGRGLPDHDQQRSNCHSPTVKPEAPSTVVLS